VLQPRPARPADGRESASALRQFTWEMAVVVGLMVGPSMGLVMVVRRGRMAYLTAGRVRTVPVRHEWGVVCTLGRMHRRRWFARPGSAFGLRVP
jgi:hypothetical protein